MANTMMLMPDTLEEFMEQNKVVDTEQIYTNGTELVPIFRIKQWLISHPCESPRWIPVTERLPEKYGRYLVTFEDEGYRSVMPLYYGRIGRISTFYDSDSEYGDIEYCGIIAWMELPEPFNDGEEEEPRYCDRNICTENEYNGVSCDTCYIAQNYNLEDDDSPCLNCGVEE